MEELHLDTVFGRLAGWRIHPRAHAADAPRVLALHGWLDNAASFLPIQPHLPGVELVALDMPGHGASAHLPLAAEYTVVNMARAIVAAADALGWDRFSMLGHSLGGAVASVVAAALPQRIVRLALVESLGALAEDEQKSARHLREAFAAGERRRRPLRTFADPAEATRARVAAGGIGEAAARLLVERGIAPARGGDRQGGFTWRSDPRLTRPTAIRMSEGQIRDQIAAIECPVQVVYARPAQTYFPEPVRQARFDCLRDGRLAVFDGGHHLHMEQPEQVAAVVAPFLRGD